MKTIMIEGFRVQIEGGERCVVFTIPELPGIVGQVESEGDVRREARALIGAYLNEMVSSKPAIKKKEPQSPKGDNGSAPKTKR